MIFGAQTKATMTDYRFFMIIEEYVYAVENYDHRSPIESQQKLNRAYNRMKCEVFHRRELMNQNSKSYQPKY